MNHLNLDPSLGLLIIKVFYFLMLTFLTGWALNPNPVFKQSRVASWVFCQSLGTGLLLLIGFNMVSFDIPAKWMVIVTPLLLSIRLIMNGLFSIKQVPYAENSDSFYRSLCIYTLGSLAIAIIYLMPFILTGSSGLYAYGGGDHSSYFRVSDIAMDKSLKDLMLSWGLVWPPTTDYAVMHATSNMFPPVQNWSINSFLFYIKYARQSMTFANQTIAVPFLAFGFNNPEESYTAGVTVYLLLLCWSAGIFASTIMRNINRTGCLALAACAVALASPAMSLVLKQTIPAVYAWGSMLLFLSVMLYRKAANNTKLGSPLAFGISIASSYLMYLPAIFVSSPLWAYLFIKGIKNAWKERITWLLIVLVVLLVSTNFEIDRPLRLFLSNAIGAILDYGLKLYFLPFTLLGVVDFESALQAAISYRIPLLAAIVIIIGLYQYIKRLNNQITVALIFTMPILFFIAYYWMKGGHYHVIRMVEFLGVVLVAMSITGFVCAYNTASKINKFIIFLLSCVFVTNAILAKIDINQKVISPVLNARAGMVSAADIKVANVLLHKYANAKVMPVIYWMGWGTIPFANHEIVFRKLRYVEAFEYDYSYVKMDLLDPQFLNDAVLLYPANASSDILEVNPKALSNDQYQLEDKIVQQIGKGSGSAILGTGWMSPTMEEGKPVRYLRSAQEAGLVVWSEQQKKVEVEIEASGVEPGMSLTLRRPELENDPLSKDRSILRSNLETGKQYFARIEKFAAQDKGSIELLYSLKLALSNYMNDNANKFNAMLLQDAMFKQFIIHNLEAHSILTKGLENKYRSEQLTYKLNVHQNASPAIKFNLFLHKGANIIRFISRDSAGRRSGRDSLTGIFYNPDINVPYVVVKKIYINSAADENLKKL
ncbi:MAG: hypothetical protein ACYC0J_00085 [Gammaproteobacteria bacterium]